MICLKKVGIIGGLGPASTLDYYKDIIEGYKAINDDHPQIIIESVNMYEMLKYLTNKDLDGLVSFLLHIINNLAAAGADFVAIASNTPHIVFDEVNKQSVLPLISIVEKTCEYAKDIDCKRVIVLGTIFTMSSGLYTNAFKKYGIEAFVPDLKNQEVVNEIIFPNLENGIVLQKEKEIMLEIANNLIDKHNADALVLGCTELPLMIEQDDIKTTVINTTQIHIKSITEQLLI